MNIRIICIGDELLSGDTVNTNFAFIGLILGGLPAIYKRVNLKKAGIPGLILFLLFFAIVVVLPLLKAPEARKVDHSFPVMLLMVGLGAIASAAMVIPGISGSMIIMLLGYYESAKASTTPSSSFPHSIRHPATSIPR